MANEFSSCEQLAPDVHYLPLMISNVCFIGAPNAPSGSWVLVDAGVSAAAERILNAAKERFGENSRPAAVILTHGHFDHVGALTELTSYWDVPIYAHEKELPFLTGEQDYPPPDPSVGGGLMSALSPAYPHHSIDVSSRIKALPNDGSLPFLRNWCYIHTPGHTPGHISLFRDCDRVLIAGDAFVTVNQESALSVLTQHEEINGPPAYFTTDWNAAKESVRKLQSLNPSLAITGHGVPICGDELSNQLKVLSDQFDKIAVPEQGRYVHS